MKFFGCWKLSMAPFTGLFFCLLAIFVHTQSVEGLNYSAEVKEVIDKFRELMGNELYQDYMTSDDFLVKWLRAQGMDLQSAQDMLRRHLKWRKDNRVNTILDEDFDDFAKMFEIGIKGKDKQGRPLFVVYFGNWDVRRVVLAGQSAKFHRYLSRAMESASQLVRTMNAASEAKNITQVLFVLDGNGWNLRQHGCLQCVPQYAVFMTTLESHYPFITSKMILVNVPRIAQAPILQLVRPLLHREHRKQFYVYGPDKEQWRRVLLELVEPDQLPTRLGGTAT